MYRLPPFTFSFLLLLAISDVAISSSKPRNQLPRGSHLSVERAAEDYLTSPDNTFSFGFFGGANVSSNAYWLAVWFTASRSLNGVVWMANRDSPVNGHGSRLTLLRDGALVLSDIDGSVTWQTNTTSAAVKTLELLNSGNLVIRSPVGEIIWQSFDLPTDTLLPGQLLTKSTRLLSRLGPGNFGSGYFSLIFDNDNVLRLIYNGPQITSIYWPYPVDQTPFQLGRTTYNSSRIVVLDDQGMITSSDQAQISASDMGIPGIKRMLKVDYDDLPPPPPPPPPPPATATELLQQRFSISNGAAPVPRGSASSSTANAVVQSGISASAATVLIEADRNAFSTALTPAQWNSVVNLFSSMQSKAPPDSSGHQYEDGDWRG